MNDIEGRRGCGELTGERSFGHLGDQAVVAGDWVEFDSWKKVIKVFIVGMTERAMKI